MLSIMVSIIHAVGYPYQLVYNIALEIIAWFFQHEEEHLTSEIWNVGHQSKHLQLLDWHFFVYPPIWLHLVGYQQSSFIFPSYSTVPPPSKYQPALFVFQNLMLQYFFYLTAEMFAWWSLYGTKHCFQMNQRLRFYCNALKTSISLQ